VDTSNAFVSRLSEAKRRPVILDGAVGTELERQGIPTPAPMWSAAAIRSHPDKVAEIHRAHAAAGAEILTANTFRVAHRPLAACGLGTAGPYLAKRAIDLARRAFAPAGEGQPAAAGFVVASVSPVADCYRPDETPPDEVLRVEYKRTLSWLNMGKPDALWLETTNSAREARVAASIARQTGLPVVVSFLLQQDGRLLSGDELAAAVEAVLPAEPAALGLNCIPPSGVTAHLPRLRALTALPVAVYAHLSQKSAVPGWSSPETATPAEYAELAVRWREMGADIIGGCCGTTAEHISAVAAALARPQTAVTAG
jgi:S-methylmethionine-dependent homocysteine/selenocysteine methylase